MVIYQKLLPRTKKRRVFYLSLKITLNYDEYPPALSPLCVNNCTLACCSGLATVSYVWSIAHHAHSLVHVTVAEDDEGGFPAQLQRHLLQVTDRTAGTGNDTRQRNGQERPLK